MLMALITLNYCIPTLRLQSTCLRVTNQRCDCTSKLSKTIRWARSNLIGINTEAKRINYVFLGKIGAGFCASISE